jgi:hypothetical protein
VRTSDSEVFTLTGGAWVDQGWKAGGSIASTPVVAKARRGSALPLTSGWNKVPLDTVMFDSLGNIAQTANGRMLVPYTGFYQVNGQCGEYQGGEMLVIVCVNGAIDSATSMRGTRTSQTGYNNGVVSGVMSLTAGDYVEMYCYTQQTVTLTCSPPDVSWMSISLLQPGVGPQTHWFSYVGTGTPATGTFAGELDSDMAIRTSDGEVFRRIIGAWVDQNWKAQAGLNQTPATTRMYRSTAFSVTTANAWTKIPLDAVTFDTVGMASVANGRVNILTDGYYKVDANIVQNTTATGTYTLIGAAIFHNGGLAAQNYSGPAIQSFGSATISDVIQCKAGDYIELCVASGQLTALNIGAIDNYLAVTLASSGPGPQGQRGSNWFTYTGSGTPAAGTFTGELDGDMAVRQSDSEVFRRVSGAWVDQGWKQQTGMATMDTMHIVGNSGEPAFANGWVNYGGGYNNCGFRKYPDGKVTLKGLVTSGAGGGSAIFTLPGPCCPPGHQLRDVQSSAGVARIDIQTTGAVTMQSAAGAGVWVSLDDIEFDTETVSVMAAGPMGPKGDPGTASFSDEVQQINVPSLAATPILCTFAAVLNGNADIEYEVILDLLTTGVAAQFACWVQPQTGSASFTTWVEQFAYTGDTGQTFTNSVQGNASMTPYGFAVGHNGWSSGGRLHAEARISALIISGQGAANVGRTGNHNGAFVPNGTSADHYTFRGSTTWWDAVTNITSLRVVLLGTSGANVAGAATGRASLRILR